MDEEVNTSPHITNITQLHEAEFFFASCLVAQLMNTLRLLWNKMFNTVFTRDASGPYPERDVNSNINLTSISRSPK
jgi:hypothetical protein